VRVASPSSPQLPDENCGEASVVRSAMVTMAQFGGLASASNCHRFEEVRRAVVAVGRALAATEAVVEPAVDLAQIFLRGDLVVAVLDLAQARVFVDAQIGLARARAFEDAAERLARPSIRRRVDERAREEVATDDAAGLDSLRTPALGERDRVSTTSSDETLPMLASDSPCRTSLIVSIRRVS
jgi:hypothetical protein